MILTYEQFNNSNINNILTDDKYKMCIELAKNNISSEQKYGALLVNNGNIIGKGYNRSIAHKQWLVKPFRYVTQGYANHAEVESINDALISKFGENPKLDIEEQIEYIKNSEIYVAGYFHSNKQLYFKDKFTCNVCVKYLKKYEIKGLYMPMPNGWIFKDLKDIIEDSLGFKINKNKDLLQRRKDIMVGDFYLKDII